MPATNLCNSQDCCLKENPTTKCDINPALACIFHELPRGIDFGAATGA